MPHLSLHQPTQKMVDIKHDFITGKQIESRQSPNPSVVYYSRCRKITVYILKENKKNPEIKSLS